VVRTLAAAGERALDAFTAELLAGAGAAGVSARQMLEALLRAGRADITSRPVDIASQPAYIASRHTDIASRLGDIGPLVGVAIGTECSGRLPGDAVPMRAADRDPAAAEVSTEDARVDPAPPGNAGRLLLTTTEAAQRLGIGRTKLYELIASGAVRSVRIGRGRRIPATALADYVRDLETVHE
jgi:excisionase family DNA binding protein